MEMYTNKNALQFADEHRTGLSKCFEKIKAVECRIRALHETRGMKYSVLSNAASMPV